MKPTKRRTRITAIMVRDDAVLTHETTDEHGHVYQALPGGKLKRNESAHECLGRELWEEFAVKIDVLQLAFVGEGFWIERGRWQHEIVLYFVAQLIDPPPLIQSREARIAARWLRMDEMDHLRPEWLRSALPRAVAAGWTDAIGYYVEHAQA